MLVKGLSASSAVLEARYVDATICDMEFLRYISWQIELLLCWCKYLDDMHKGEVEDVKLQ